MRESFIFYKSFYDAIKELPLEEQSLMYNAIIEYVLFSKKPKFSGINSAIWSLIRPQLDANIKRFENGKLGATHGKKGGRPWKSKITPSEPQDNPDAVKKITPNNNVNVNVNDNVNDNYIYMQKNDLQEIVDFYNETFEKNITSTKSFEDSYFGNSKFEGWSKVHSIDKIKKAIWNARNDKYWSKIMTLTILFRIKNQNGEKVDYIEDLANRNPLEQHGNISII